MSRVPMAARHHHAHVPAPLSEKQMQDLLFQIIEDQVPEPSQLIGFVVALLVSHDLVKRLRLLPRGER